MKSSSTADEPLPTNIPSGGSVSEKNVRVYEINSPYNCPTPHVFSPQTVSDAPSCSPRPMFVSCETKPFRSPALTTCISCQTQVTTEVTFKAGTYTWLMCLVFILCGLIFGCCLIPFFVNYFKDAYHTCPDCRQVLHIQRRTCCE